MSHALATIAQEIDGSALKALLIRSTRLGREISWKGVVAHVMIYAAH